VASELKEDVIQRGSAHSRIVELDASVSEVFEHNLQRLRSILDRGHQGAIISTDRDIALGVLLQNLPGAGLI
jgi:hypothetical protein